MSRGLALNLLASALTILAAIALLVAAAVVADPPPAAPAGGDTPRVVYAFYDAVNEVLRSGDPAALDGVVAPHFAMHGAPGAVSPDRHGLAGWLVAASAATPNRRLEPVEVVAAADRAVVHLAREDRAEGSFLGVPFADPPAFWGRSDALRAEDGRVAELWTSGEAAPLLAPLRHVRLDRLPTPDRAVVLRRHGAEAGGAWTLEAAFQPCAFYVAAGTAVVEVDPLSPVPAAVFAAEDGGGEERPIQPGERALLRAGDAVAFPVAAVGRLRDGPSRGAFLAYEVTFPRHPTDEPPRRGWTPPPHPTPVPDPARSETERLAALAATGVPHGPLLVSFGRVTLPPGAPLAFAEAPGPMLLAVEAGTVGVDGSRGGPGPGSLRLPAGGATAIARDEARTLRALGDEPVVAFAATVAVAPAGAWSAQPPRPAPPAPAAPGGTP